MKVRGPDEKFISFSSAYRHVPAYRLINPSIIFIRILFVLHKRLNRHIFIVFDVYTILHFKQCVFH